MLLDLTETQDLMRSGSPACWLVSCRGRGARTRDGGGVDAALWRTLAAAGWRSLRFADDADDPPLLDTALVLAEVARSGAIVPFLETAACSFALAEGDGELDAHRVWPTGWSRGPAVARRRRPQ